MLKTFYKDNDGDGYGGVMTQQGCVKPSGYAEETGDCNDFNNDIHPGATEVCNDVDDDCDGFVDDGLPTQRIYKDNDGDGYAANNAAAMEKCNVPTGWTTTNTPPDCDDSDSTVYPRAPEACDNKDNDCDGLKDRYCFTPCEGAWPYDLTYASGGSIVTAADLDGDGRLEVHVQNGFGFAILDSLGGEQYEYSAPQYNYSRNRLVLADVDDYDRFGPSVQTLEVLTGNGSKPRFYKCNPGGSVTLIESSVGVYDASRFMASDLDGDGVVEFFTSSWCEASAGTKVFRFDRATGGIVHAGSIPDPEGKCEYYDGRFLSDLDGDGVAELVFGNGYSFNQTPSFWAGHIFALRFRDFVSLLTESYCSTCFPTEIEGLYGGAVGDLFRLADRIHAQVLYFETNIPAQNNPSTWRYWAFDLGGAPLPGYPRATAGTFYPTDVDDDGIAESDERMAFIGLWDVNGDGYPDSVYSSGRELRLGLYDPQTKKWVEHVPSRVEVSSQNVSVQSIWDLTEDNRLDVLATDTSGRVHCYQLGPQTFNRYSSLPPHFPALLRTYQWDNFEPNEGDDRNADGIPDRFIRIPSAVTAKGNFYSYISTQDDKDYYLLDTNWNGSICLRAPKGRSYHLKVFSFYDKWDNESHAPGADGRPDGLVWEQSTSPGGSVCFHGGMVAPNRYGEYRFVVGVESHSGYSPYWPYWITAAK